MFSAEMCVCPPCSFFVLFFYWSQIVIGWQQQENVRVDSPHSISDMADGKETLC